MEKNAKLANQRGGYMMNLSVMMIVLFIVTIGMARQNTNTLRLLAGQTIGNQLTSVATGLGNFIAVNQSALIANTAITGVATTRNPMLYELQGLGYVSTNVSQNPSYGTAYNIAVSVLPSGCTTTCQIIGEVYLANPIYNSDGQTSDIKILGAAVASSTSGSIGFSMPSSPSTITGPGWTVPNPDATQRSGILMAAAGLGGGSSSSGSSTMYWKAPVANFASLPTAGNIVGDGRIILDKYRAFVWNGTAWKAIAQDQNGDIAVTGNIAATGNITTVGNATFGGSLTATLIQDSGLMNSQSTNTNSLTLNSSIASSGSSCSGVASGTIAKDASGNLYVCR